MAYAGKLVTVQETLGEKPNGTSFAITLRAAPALDATNLVIGKACAPPPSSSSIAVSYLPLCPRGCCFGPNLACRQMQLQAVDRLYYHLCTNGGACAGLTMVLIQSLLWTIILGTRDQLATIVGDAC